MMNNQNYGGIDIAKRNFVIGITSSKKTKAETNNEKGFAPTIDCLNRHQLTVVVMESTGGPEIPLAKALYRAGIKVIIANPRQTNRRPIATAHQNRCGRCRNVSFLRTNDRAKARLGTAAVHTPPDEAEEVLVALINRRNQLVDMRAAEKNRLQQVHPSQEQSVSDLIEHLDTLIADLDKQIDQHNRTYFDGQNKLLQSIKGVGRTTSATLCALLPELGKVSHKQVACPVGVAPHPRESGETRFKSRCFGGREAVRKTLYMAAMVATNHEPRIKDFYQRLILRGKPCKVSINACMRKLLTILNAMMRDYLAEAETAEAVEAAV